MNSPPVSEALILMAGTGSRLRGTDQTFLKPLVPVLGRPLVSYTLKALANAGIYKITAVVGFEGQRLSAALKKLLPSGMRLRLVENPDWKKQNGISVLTARNQVEPPFLLTMCDHLFDREIVDLLLEHADVQGVALAVDKKPNSCFDLEDAMKVQTRDNRVIKIGKDLSEYDALDTGLFICSNDIFDYLERAKKGGDCSLSDGIRLMAGDNKVRAVDIGEAWWQDVDTAGMLGQAESFLRARLRRDDASAAKVETGRNPKQ